MKKYYFALDELLADLSLRQVDARKKFGFDRPGEYYISRTGFQKLCNRPAQVRMDTINVICSAMGVTPADLWRME